MNSTNLLIYFAYGSNLCRQRLEARIGPVNYLGNAQLPNYALHCHQLGKDQSGKCNIVSATHLRSATRPAMHYCHENYHVWGCLYEMTADQKTILDAFEGVGHGYDAFQTEVLAINHTRPMTVFSYLNAQPAVDHTVKPYRWYLDYILSGAKEAALPENYIAQLAQIGSINDDNTARHEHNQAILQKARLHDHDNHRDWQPFEAKTTDRP